MRQFGSRLKILAASLLCGAGLLSAAAVPQALANDTVVLSIDPFLTLDPATSRATAGNLTILSQVYSSLTTTNAEGKVIGDLAQSWDVKSATEFVFKLHPNAVFQNGKPLDAAAVVANFARMKDPAVKATANTGFEAIESVTAPDATTVVIKTKKPWLELPRRLSWMFMVEPEWAKTANPRVEINASGPYMVTSYNPGSEIVLQRNPKFYGKPAAVEKVVYRFIGAAATRLSGIRSGEITGTLRINPIDLQQLNSLPNYEVGAIEGQRYTVIKFHFGRKSLADLRVRQAINYAINKEAITKAVFRGYVGPGTTQVLNPQTDGFDPNYKPWPYDPKRAKELLAAAGYEKGLSLELMAAAEGAEVAVPEVTQIIAAQLAQVGITLKVSIVPTSVWMAVRSGPEEKAPDMTYTAPVSQSNSATELFQQFGSKSASTYGPMPPAFDKAVAAAEVATDPADQVAKLRAASQQMLDDCLIVYLWRQPQTFAKSKKIQWTVRSDDWLKASEMSPSK